jgi:transcriptional regulator with XRE-family HTH domain
MPPVGKSDSVDVRVGHRVRALRLQRGLSQRELGMAIGASAEDMRQFEAGLKRIGATRLMRIARAFDVDVAVLFESGGARTAKPDGVGGRVRPTTSRSLH